MQPFAYCLRLIDITNYLNEKNMNKVRKGISE